MTPTFIRQGSATPLGGIWNMYSALAYHLIETPLPFLLVEGAVTYAAVQRYGACAALGVPVIVYLYSNPMLSYNL